MRLLTERGFAGLFRQDVTATTTWTQAVTLREPAAANRLVVVAVATQGTNSHTISSCTVFGTSLANSVNTGAAGTNAGAIFSGYVTSGDNGNIVVTISAAVPRWAMAVYSYPAASATATATASDIGAPMSQNVALTDGSVLIAVTYGVAAEASHPNWVYPMRKVWGTKAGSLNFSTYKYKSRLAETRNIGLDWDLGAVERMLAVVHV